MGGVARLSSEWHHLLVCLPGRESVSESEPAVGTSLSCDFPPHCDSYLGLGVRSVGPPLGMQAEQKRRKGFYQAGSACLTTSQHHGRPGQGDEPQVTKFGTCPIRPAPLNSPFHVERWAAEGRYAWASRARRQQCRAGRPSRDPRPWPLLCGHLWSLQRGFGGHGRADLLT